MADFEQKVLLKAVDNISKEMKKVRRSSEKALGKMRREAKKTQGSFNNMRGSILSVKTAMIALGAIATGRIVRGFIKAGSEVEDLTTQFEVLLGTTSKAMGRMEDLEKFAQSTPFQLGGVAEANRILEVMGDGALSSMETLRMLGDAAAITAEKDIANLAVWVGRAYDGLQNNKPVGEAMMRLSELGLVSGKARTEIEALQKAGKGTEAWTVLQDSLKKNEGSMEKLSKTVTGLTSTIKDQLNAAMRQMMESGVWDSLRDILTQVVAKFNEMLKDGTFAKWGDNLKLIARLARTLITALAVNKLVSIGSGFLQAAGGVKSFGGAMKGLNLNPVIATITAVQLAIDAVISTMEKVAKKRGEVEWMDNRDQLAEIRQMRIEWEGFNEMMLKGGNNAEYARQEITRIDKKMKSVTGWTFRDQEASFLKVESLNRQIHALDLMAVKKKKVEDDDKKDPTTPAGSNLKAVKAGVDIEKNLTKEFLDEQAQVRKDARQSEFVAQYDHQIAVLQFAETTREQELELNRLHFEKLAEQEQGGLKDTLRRRELERLKADKIAQKWDKKEQAEQDKKLSDWKKWEEVRVDGYWNMAKAGIESSAMVGEALGLSGKALKRFAMAESAVMGVRAFFQALTAPPGAPFTIPQATAVGVLAATKTGIIASQAFQTGGIPTGKNSIVKVNEAGQEGILNARAFSEMGAGELNARNQGIPQAQTVNNEIVYSPTINIGDSAPEGALDILRGDLPGFAQLVVDSVDRGFLKGAGVPVWNYKHERNTRHSQRRGKYKRDNDSAFNALRRVGCG